MNLDFTTVLRQQGQAMIDEELVHEYELVLFY